MHVVFASGGLYNDQLAENKERRRATPASNKTMNPPPTSRESSPHPLRVVTEISRKAAILKAGALQNAILNSANFSSIANDAEGVIQVFNIGAERMPFFRSPRGRRA